MLPSSKESLRQETVMKCRKWNRYLHLSQLICTYEKLENIERERSVLMDAGTYRRIETAAEAHSQVEAQFADM